MLAVMILNEQDKEALVLDLLNKRYTARQIAKQAHISFTDIARIKRKATGELMEDNKEKIKSMASQSFRMFLENKSLVDVAIALDIPTEQVISIYKDYLTLQRMSKIVSILNKHRGSIPAFLTWFEYIEKNKVKVKDITKAIDYIKDMQLLQQQQGG
jgi:hypothetical protein